MPGLVFFQNVVCSLAEKMLALLYALLTELELSTRRWGRGPIYLRWGVRPDAEDSVGNG